MGLKDIYKNGFVISFEIFPPKTRDGLDKLYDELNILSTYNPAFISVTYGAGGSTREKTIELALEIKDRYIIDPLVHFTCVGSTKEEIREYLDRIRSYGLVNILALRGDPPRGESSFVPHKNGFSYASDLIEYIRSIGDFSVAVAGYPEKHLESPSLEVDIDNLKRKIDAGGELILTQLFFDNEKFKRYVDLVRKKGIEVPVVPGIMPVTGESQIKRFTEMCGATVPDALMSRLASLPPESFAEAGIEWTIKQCRELLKFGVPGFHFYPLNKSDVVKKIIDAVI